MKTKSVYLGVILLGVILSAPTVEAYNNGLSFNVLPSVTYGRYSGSQQRDTFSEVGVMLSADYFGVGGLTLGVSNSHVTRQDDVNNSFNTVNQQNYVISARKYFDLDPAGGSMTLRLDGHRINNDDNISNTDGVSVIAPQVSWLSSRKMLYVDLGYANSNYSGQSAVYQFTPTIGFGLNSGFDWIQLRGTIINGLNSTATEGRSSTTALDGKWTHYFSPGAWFIPARVALGFSIGEKILAVDMDALSVANLADLNKGGANIMLTWNVAKLTQISVFAGQTLFRNLSLDDDYRLNVAYINLSVNW